MHTKLQPTMQFDLKTKQYYNVIQSHTVLVMGITSVRLKPEIETPLEDLSKELDRSKSYLINQAIQEFLERRANEAKQWKETLEAIESVKSGRVIDEKEVNNWLSSWGTDKEINPPKV